MDHHKFEALKYYDLKRASSLEEFISDYNRVVTIKRNIGRIEKGGYSGTMLRVTLNHFIILFNCFGQYAEVILRYHIPENLYPIMYSFIESCNYNVSNHLYDSTILELINE